mmetsp:Transcript_24029/g.83386  ORF Transcript_24029/g.83386 Transcript_24029/m.83386 type:complete len:236 (+) Transcript_24029:838-1545(+)
MPTVAERSDLRFEIRFHGGELRRQQQSPPRTGRRNVPHVELAASVALPPQYLRAVANGVHTREARQVARERHSVPLEPLRAVHGRQDDVRVGLSARVVDDALAHVAQQAVRHPPVLPVQRHDAHVHCVVERLRLLLQVDPRQFAAEDPRQPEFAPANGCSLIGVQLVQLPCLAYKAVDLRRGGVARAAADAHIHVVIAKDEFDGARDQVFVPAGQHCDAIVNGISRQRADVPGPL